MAYLSDVDLATLHRSRLEERVHYKLSSWWQRSATVGGVPKQIQTQHVVVNGTAPSGQISTNHRSSCSANMDDIINNNEHELAPSVRRVQQLKKMPSSTCEKNTIARLEGSRQVVPSNHRAGAGRHQSNVHVIKQRNRSSNSCSSSSCASTGTSASSSSAASNSYKHVEWIDDDYLNDDGYFSSETRRRRSGTWP